MKWIKTGIFILYIFLTFHIVVRLSEDNGSLLVLFICIPLCSWIIVLIHELSHFFCFKLFGFSVKELRIGLFVIKFSDNFKKIKVEDNGFFYGFCVIENNHQEKKVRLIFSLLAGSLSGISVSLVSFTMIMLMEVPNKWTGLLLSFICVGIYSFYATLLSPRSADRKLIKRIMKK